jgi:phosphonate transport system permease protein
VAIRFTPTENLRDVASRYPDVFKAAPGKGLRAGFFIGIAVTLFVYGLMRLDVSPMRVLAGLSQLGWFVALMLPPDPAGHLALYLWAMVETLAIAFLGTCIAAVIALPFGFLAARNVIPSWLWRFVTRRFLDTVRSVDTLIWALIWISVVGLGPFAGVLAIASSDFGAFGKLFSETIETVDKKAREGMRSTGASELEEIRFGLIPEIVPVFAAQILYYFESNTRSATIIGIVGAGGLGLHLSEQIRTLEWQTVSFLILMILVAVAVIDWLSAKLRFAIIGKKRTD